MKQLAALLLFVCSSHFLLGQSVGISSTGVLPDESAMLDISSTEKGALLPRMTLADKESISTPAEGLTVFQTDEKTGYYVYQNGTWNHLGPINANDDLEITELDEANSYNMPLFGVQTIYDMSGVLYDTGGPTGDYSNNEAKTSVIYAFGAIGLIIKIEECNLESPYDSLTIFGKSYTGNELDSIFIPYYNAVINFRSNNVNVASGFKITWQAVLPTEVINEDIKMISGWQYEPSKHAVFGGLGSCQSFTVDSLGIYSVNYGNNTKGLANYSVSFGYRNTNRSGFGTTLGQLNNIQGAYSLVAGTSNVESGERNVAMGDNINVEGIGNTLNSRNSTISGDHNIGSPTNSTLNGNYNLLTGDNIEVNGNNNIVTSTILPFYGSGNIISGAGHSSFNQNTNNIISGSTNYLDDVNNSLLLGENNTVFGDNCITGGTGNQLQGFNSLVVGEGNFSNFNNALVAGRYMQNTYTHIPTTEFALFSIGMGTSTTDRKSGLTLTDQGKLILGANKLEEINLLNDNEYYHFSGNQTFGTLEKAGILASLEGDSESGGIFFNGDAVTIWSPGDGQSGDGLSTSASLIILDEDNWNDGNSNPYDNGAIEAYLDPAGLWQQSDQNKKENIQPVTNSLEKISSLSAYTYQFKSTPEETAKGQVNNQTIGLMAQELHGVIPQAVTVSEHGDYFVNYSQIVPMLIESIKELKAEIEELKKK